MNRNIIIWDYWIDYKIQKAYCIGIIDGILYFSESHVDQLPEDNEGEE